MTEGSDHVVDTDPRCPTASTYFGRCVYDLTHPGPCLYQQSRMALTALEETKKP